jgi:hypothetical protein
MSRYAQAVEQVLPRLDLQSPGIGILVVASGQHSLVAEALTPHLPEAARAPLEAALVRAGPAVLVATGLPANRAEAEAALTELNSLRGWVASSGRLLVLLLTRQELAELQRLAADVYSARLFLETIGFIPEPAVEFEQARAELARWQRERFGRLDLRGFVRSEGEDVSWRIEDIYQDVSARDVHAVFKRNHVWWEVVPRSGGSAPWLVGREPSLLQLLDLLRASMPAPAWMAVVLGHPGSGKTFFLRWLTMRAGTQEQVVSIRRPLPLLTSLSAYAQSPGPISLYEYFLEVLLENGQSAAHVLGRAVAERRAIFLLDGLDEVGDESARRRMIEAVRAFQQEVAGCLVVVTSRIAGYTPGSLPAAEFALSPLNEEAIRSFLVRWCELYALERLGDSPSSRQQGGEEGERLANDVLQHKQVYELARSPLLLTVLAMVHRTGVRLPDHRVELYEHATRVLVERWNRVRSLSPTGSAPPLKAADAVRLLGPVALETIRMGTRGAIKEEVLRELLGRSLISGNLRGITTPDEALTLFKNALGLLIEQGPGLYSFLHLTLSEYFAARELVRSNGLERLAEDASRAFRPEWREVLLLAAGELGVNRADDARLELLVGSVLDTARRQVARPTASVPSLLAGLLADDPGLSSTSATQIIDTLVPAWWFESTFDSASSLEAAVREASELLHERISQGRFAAELRGRLKPHYGNAAPAHVLENLVRSGAASLNAFLKFLRAADLDYGPVFFQYMRDSREEFRKVVGRFSVPCAIHADEESARVRVVLSQWLDQQVRHGTVQGEINFIIVNPLSPTVTRASVSWEQMRFLGAYTDADVLLEADIPVEWPTGQKPATPEVFAFLRAKFP